MLSSTNKPLISQTNKIILFFSKPTSNETRAKEVTISYRDCSPQTPRSNRIIFLTSASSEWRWGCIGNTICNVLMEDCLKLVSQYRLPPFSTPLLIRGIPRRTAIKVVSNEASLSPRVPGAIQRPSEKGTGANIATWRQEKVLNTKIFLLAHTSYTEYWRNDDYSAFSAFRQLLWSSLRVTRQPIKRVNSSYYQSKSSLFSTFTLVLFPCCL